MLKVIDQNDVFRKFDFSSLIDQKDNDEVCRIVHEIVASGNYFTNSPRFQTKENIFARKEEIWVKYRMSFLFSVFLYLGKEVKVGNTMAWSFMTNLAGAEDREKLWHNHWHPSSEDVKMLSGIFYLKIPDDVKDRDYCGTEVAPDGLDQETVYVKPQDFSWLIYPSDIWHRPGIVQSDQYRFVLAADVEYLP